jgi:hypothetical protein
MAVKVPKVFQVLMLCNTAVQYQCFGGPYCLHLQAEVNDAGKRGIAIGIENKRWTGASSQWQAGKGSLAARR